MRTGARPGPSTRPRRARLPGPARPPGPHRPPPRRRPPRRSARPSPTAPSSTTRSPLGRRAAARLGDEQAPGRYRLRRRGDEHALRLRRRPDGLEEVDLPVLRPADHATKRRPQGRASSPESAEHRPVAFLGVRACEIAALGVQDRVFTRDQFIDPDYQARRAAGASSSPSSARPPRSTCFCTSMGTGPEVERRVRHPPDRDRRRLRRRRPARPPAGRSSSGCRSARPPPPSSTAPRRRVAAVRARIGDPVPTAGLHERLMAQLDHPRWAQVAERCITCGNCTLACPTCFCTTLVAGDRPGRRRRPSTDRQLGQLLQPRLRQGRRRRLPGAPARPLPAVADPQVRDLVGPVRELRLRRLRPLHHLVPGRHRRPRGAERDRPAGPARPRAAARRAGRRHARTTSSPPGSSPAGRRRPTRPP